jgi:signal recognition particle subunit SRP54
VTVDEELMDEVRDVKAAIRPHETLLVADALTGQDAVHTAKAFDGHIGVTGIVLTRADGDGRGGAALSMRAVTGKPIKLIGVGEKWDALEDFHPGRIASRILGMGDVVSLVEKAAQNIDIEKATKIAEKMKKGSFDLEDLSDQLAQMQKLGGMGGVLGMLPGVAKIKGQINEAGLDKSLVHQRAIISSMTPKERRNPKILDAKRKRRIAAGSGTKPEDINKLIKMHRQMADMMKTMGRNGSMLNKFLGRTGAGPSEAEMQSMQAELAKLDPKALEQLPEDLKEQFAKGAAPSSGSGGGLPSLPPGLVRGLPGLGGGLPKGLPGLGGGMPKFPGLPGKKR